MKKKIIVIGVIITLLILLIPIPFQLKDGGTIKFKALIYEISKVHKLNHESEYDEGFIIKILGREIYNNVSSKIENYSEIKENNYLKEIDDLVIELKIPSTWKYEEIAIKDNYKFALKLYKDKEDKNATLYYYKERYGVCGTGRTTEKIKLNNGNSAFIGYYASSLSDIIVNDNVVFINNGIENNDYDEFLNIVKTINVRSR